MLNSNRVNRERKKILLYYEVRTAAGAQVFTGCSLLVDQEKNNIYDTEENVGTTNC